MQYKKCPDCGDNNGYGERCDCKEELESIEVGTDVIVIKQLPLIEEHLREIGEAAKVKVEEVLSLPCTDENIQTVKKQKAALKKEWEAFEQKRIGVEREILNRLSPFKESFKKNITDIYKPADEQLKSRIAVLEDEKKKKMRDEVKAYFDEYALVHGIDFVSFDKTGINVILSASMKNLKEQAKSFIDKICDDISLIVTQEHSAEILVEYRKSLNVSKAITDVKARVEAIEAQKRRQEELAEQAKVKAEAVQKVEEALPPPVVQPPRPTVTRPVVREKAKLYTVSFKVKSVTVDQVKVLKKFLNEGGYQYE